MDSLQVKICGITDLADARYAASLGAHKLGFIQVPESPRYISPEGAAAIIDWLSGSDPVGVLVNRTPGDINRIAEMAGFKQIQLHGEESPEECAMIHVPVIKAFRIHKTDTVTTVVNRISQYESVASLFLLDTFSPIAHGGTGQTFDWEIARNVAERFPILLAGGLTPNNVADAIRFVKPVGIDISSGIEHAPGKKDFDKMDALFEAITATRTK